MIETERLVLRAPGAEDLPWIRAEMNSEAVMRHLGVTRSDEQAWGQGYATEAARAALGYGFAASHCAAIFGQTSDSNIGSTRMMPRLGFERLPALDYFDPDYPVEDNPTTVWRIARKAWGGRA